MRGSSSRVSLVRCPKCGHLLPELPPYSVYCCGGCGAYLQAEKGSSVDDVLSENSIERTGEGSKPVRSRYGDEIRKSPISGDPDARSHSSGRSAPSMDGFARKAPLTEIGIDGHGKSPARSVRSVRGGVRKPSVVGELYEQRSMGSDFVADYEEMEAREKVGAWFDHVKEETVYGHISATHYEASVDESELNRPIVSPRKRMGRREAEFVVNSSRRPLEVHHDGYVDSVPRRFPVYPNEGRSSYPSHYGYDQPRQYQESYAGSSSLQNAERNRAELFRLYNDLKEQLSITGDLPENSVRSHHRISSAADFYGGPEDYAYDDEHLRLRGPTGSVDLDDRSRMRPHYVDRSRLPAPPSRFVPNEFSYDDDPSWQQIPQRASHHPTHFHPHRSSQEFIPIRSADSSYDSSGINRFPEARVNRRYPNYQNNAAAVFPDPYDQHSSGSRFPSSSPHGISSRSKNSVESKSDEGGLVNEHNKRVTVLNTNQLVCHPIVGAAPFVICHSCTQLLRLPKKLITSKKTQLTMQCGSCHTTLSFDFSSKKSRSSTEPLPKFKPDDVDDEPSKKSESDNIKTHAGFAAIGKRESYDFDANGYTFPSTDSEPSMLLEDRRPNSFEPQKHFPSSSNASKRGLDLENAVSNTDASIPLINKIALRPPPGSPLQEHLEYSAMFSIKQSDETEADVSGYDKGIAATDSSSLNNAQVADRMADLQIKSNEVLKLDMSHSLEEASSNNGIGGSKRGGESSFANMSGRRSIDLSPPHDVLSKRGGESSFAGMSGRRSVDLSPPRDELSKRGGESSFSSMSGRRSVDLSPPHDVLSTQIDVFVNGQHLAHREVKKAEKLAGPILPGRYWYDSRAGFWGIMGNRCLGIIPPFIEEFGSPMPVDSAGGNTSICLNGRELHEKDLELLASRGFPRIKNKSYAIDISGKVEDEETGDVVAKLGKLAPTVEKTKRGFGMQPSEVLED